MWKWSTFPIRQPESVHGSFEVRFGIEVTRRLGSGCAMTVIGSSSFLEAFTEVKVGPPSTVAKLSNN